jgi:hypothetical protein
MFRHKHTNFRERDVSGSKPTASDKPLFTQSVIVTANWFKTLHIALPDVGTLVPKHVAATCLTVICN